ncbi:hypothetical protein RB653_003374 [Dictyostelium firmibasis]|uniref:Thioredoxin domain-containing protein n=1 Tax=Dictyostelium firmibasis TaxID=79012 RepID=A0AAN7YWY7_9MYCE
MSENNTNNGLDEDFDDDDELSKIREQRIKQLKEESKLKQQFLSTHGELKEIDEQDFLKEVTGTDNVVVHFYHSDFQRCKILDKSLDILAKTHLGTKFLKINAEKAQFFTGKLGVRVLPTLVFFSNGIAVDRCVGFDEFGGSDSFKIEQLAMRISKAGVLDFKHTTGLKIISKQDAKNNKFKEDD